MSNEINEYFADGTVPHLVLTSGYASPFNLDRYKVIITMYDYVVNEEVRLRKYKDDMDSSRKDEFVEAPKNPNLTFFSGFFGAELRPLVGGMLVLNEAHQLKNPATERCLSLTRLRKLFHTCIMATGTPFDNTWRDAFHLINLLVISHSAHQKRRKPGQEEYYLMLSRGRETQYAHVRRRLY